jgi:hypothetical protein
MLFFHEHPSLPLGSVRCGDADHEHKNNNKIKEKKTKKK